MSAGANGCDEVGSQYEAEPSVQLRAMTSVYAIDTCLAPFGLAVAFAAQSSPWGGSTGASADRAPLGIRPRAPGADRPRARAPRCVQGTAFLLGDVVEADDAYTGIHSRDVVELTLSVVDRLELSSRERRDAEFAALLHDVGKVRIPNEIINKPGRLTPEERKVIETHTIEGERMLHRVGGLLGEIGRIVRSCHENYDGSGYPDGLAGDEIPLLRGSSHAVTRSPR